MRQPTVPRKVYDYLVKHWVVSALLLTLSSHWFILLRLVGKTWGLVDPQGNMTATAHWITWPLFTGSVAFALLRTAADKYNEQAKNDGQFVLERLLWGVNAVTSAKMRRFCDFIHGMRGQQGKEAFASITQPRLQIERLLENLQITLSEIFGISRDEIGLSLIYQLDGRGEWEWLYTMNTTDDINLQTLMQNPETTVRQVVDSNLKSLFFPDKRVGAAEHRYWPGPKDRVYNNIGSVLCRDISVGHEPRAVRAILSLTTYGKQLCEQHDSNAVQKIENLIMSTFQTRLQLEIALLYIKEVLNPKCLNCPC